jgi:hypothetical protein
MGDCRQLRSQGGSLAARISWGNSPTPSTWLLGKSLRGGLVVVGGINPLPNAIDAVELAVEKGASVMLIPVSARNQLFDLPDDTATEVNMPSSWEAREAFHPLIERCYSSANLCNQMDTSPVTK